MARRLFFVENVHHGRAELHGEEARHLRRVLRAEVGQRYEISDNEALYLASIEDFGKDQIVFRVEERLEWRTPVARVTLYAALIKFDAWEWMLEKATELGVERIVPVVADRSEKGLERAAVKRMERWRRIVLESCQQARRPRLVELEAPVGFGDALKPGGGLFMEEAPGAPPLLWVYDGRDDAVSMLLGPEGGWTDRERGAASDAGWRAVSLGPQVLRAETAAIASLAAIAAARERRLFDTRGAAVPMPT